MISIFQVLTIVTIQVLLTLFSCFQQKLFLGKFWQILYDKIEKVFLSKFENIIVKSPSF